MTSYQNDIEGAAKAVPIMAAQGGRGGGVTSLGEHLHSDFPVAGTTTGQAPNLGVDGGAH